MMSKYGKVFVFAKLIAQLKIHTFNERCYNCTPTFAAYLKLLKIADACFYSAVIHHCIHQLIVLKQVMLI